MDLEALTLLSNIGLILVTVGSIGVVLFQVVKESNRHTEAIVKLDDDTLEKLAQKLEQEHDDKEQKA